jgi:hypothetical protein
MSGNPIVDLDYFFESPERFPWDYMGIPYPGCGSLSSCLSRAAATFCNPVEAAMIKTATYSELKRMSQIEGAETIRSIVQFLDSHNDPGTQRGKAKLIMIWLDGTYTFTEMMQEKLDKAYVSKVISIPRDALLRVI